MTFINKSNRHYILLSKERVKQVLCYIFSENITKVKKKKYLEVKKYAKNKELFALFYSATIS